MFFFFFAKYFNTVNEIYKLFDTYLQWSISNVKVIVPQRNFI